MKPSSLVAILLRLGSIVLFLYALSASILPVVAMFAMHPNSPSSANVLGLLTPVYLIFTILPLVISVLIYIWSLPLAYLITRDLE